MAKFYRVDGGSTQHRGVIPDIIYPSRHDPMDFGESSQVNALMWDQIAPARYRKYSEIGESLKKLEMRHKKRIASNREFQYLVEDIREMEAEDARKSISLNEEKRQTERKNREAKRLARENERRAALGLPPASKDDEDTERLEIRDFVRDESAHILVDWILLQNGELATTTKEADFEVNNH